MSCGGKQDSLLPSARGPAPSLRGRRLDSDNFVLSEQVSLSQSEPRVTLSPLAALEAWINIWPGHRIVNQRADTPSGGKLLLSVWGFDEPQPANARAAWNSMSWSATTKSIGCLMWRRVLGSIVRNTQFRLYGSALCAFIHSRGDHNLVSTPLLSKIECRIRGA
jgi:hypothetical protein